MRYREIQVYRNVSSDIPAGKVSMESPLDSK
jgi:hypothetical protein